MNAFHVMQKSWLTNVLNEAGTLIGGEEAKEKSKMEAESSEPEKKKRKMSSNKVMWKSIVQIKFTEDEPQMMFYKYDYQVEEYRESQFMNEGSETRQKNKRVISKDVRKYNKPRGITAQKKKDLMKLCEKTTSQKHTTRFINHCL